MTQNLETLKYNGPTDWCRNANPELSKVNSSLLLLSDSCTSDIVVQGHNGASNVKHSKVLLVLFIFIFNFNSEMLIILFTWQMFVDLKGLPLIHSYDSIQELNRNIEKHERGHDLVISVSYI